MNYIREAIEYLRNYKNLKLASENLREKLYEINEDLSGYKEIKFDDMPHGSSNVADDKLCNLIFNRDRTEEQYVETINAIEKISNILNKLDEEDRQIIEVSYVMDLTEYEILKELNISRATYFRNRSRAIRKLAVQLFGIKVIA